MSLFPFGIEDKKVGVCVAGRLVRPSITHSDCENQRSQLGRLAQLLDCPFTWDDLVVPEGSRDALADLAFEARNWTA